MGDQPKGRHTDFLTARRIRLADGREWMFPAPAGRGASHPNDDFGEGYLKLIEAIVEAEDGAEERMAELALAILFLGREHALTPAEYRYLLEFEPDSPELAEFQEAFHELAKDHVEYVLAGRRFPRAAGPGGNSPGLLARLGRWLRNS